MKDYVYVCNQKRVSGVGGVGGDFENLEKGGK
jgi:hypothetical protein